MDIALPLNSGSCGIALDVQVANWVELPEATRAQTYRCPVCKATQTADIPGQITFIARRIEPFRKPADSR
jgi:hypothetical protein